MLPRFEVVARRRPVDLVGTVTDPVKVGAPSLAIEATLGPGVRASVTFVSGPVELQGWYDGAGFGLHVTTGGTAGGTGGRTTRHQSRRDGTPAGPVDGLGLSLTGRHLTVLSRHEDVWTARGRVNLERRVDTHDEAFLAGVEARVEGVVDHRVGTFGQFGLRDLRLVTRADGAAYRPDGRVLLSATSAGPGFFDTAHTSLWSLDPATYDLEHRSDLYFRRPGRTGRPGVYGDHATHVVRDQGGWLVATSTWGDFDPRVKGATVGVTLTRTDADLLIGQHVLDSRPLPLPTTGFRSVGVWDPHLVHTDDGWLVAYVSATTFFRFHPVLATGPALDDLTLRGRVERRATEGPTLLRLQDRWVLAASDGRDNPKGQREAYPVFDLDLREIGALEADYPTNIPWPTLVEERDGWLMVGFDGTSYGGRLVGYGSHGDVVVQRSVGTAP